MYIVFPINPKIINIKLSKSCLDALSSPKGPFEPGGKKN